MIFNKKLLRDLNKNEKEKITWLEKNKNKAMSMTITEVAKKLDCSPSFITKTLKKVGYYGWKDFMAILMNYRFASKYKNKYDSYIKNTLIPSINISIGNNDEMQINDFAKLISTTKKDIYFIGEGFSHFIALDQVRRYNKIGIRCFELNAVDYHIASIKPSSIIILISGSGLSESIQKTKKFLNDKEKSNILALVTSNNRIDSKDYNYLFKGMTHDVENENEREIPKHSRIIILILLDWIFTKVLQNTQKGKNINEILINSSYNLK